MECVEGKEKPISDGRDASEKGFILSLPRLHYALFLALHLSFFFFFSFLIPFSPLFLILPYQDAETVMSQAASPPDVTQAPELSPAPAPLSSPAPVALTSAMPITATCLLWGALGLLVPRVPRPSQVTPGVLNLGGGWGPG